MSEKTEADYPLREVGLCGFDGICTKKVDAKGNCPEHGQPVWAIEGAKGRPN